MTGYRSEKQHGIVQRSPTEVYWIKSSFDPFELVTIRICTVTPSSQLIPKKKGITFDPKLTLSVKEALIISSTQNKVCIVPQLHTMVESQLIFKSNVYKMHQYLDARQWYKGKDNIIYPTRKACPITFQCIELICNVLEKAALFHRIHDIQPFSQCDPIEFNENENYWNSVA